jgi:AcrR family transcriptional regulator
MVKINKTLRRRANLREALIEAAEKTIAIHGLKGLRARSLAFDVGCAVGAIYNVVNDIDDLIFAVNERTLQMLEDELLKPAANGQGTEQPIDRLVRFAVTYLNFAADHGLRWRAIFEHSMNEGSEVPDWYRGRQSRLFGYLDGPLSELAPEMTPARRRIVGRSLFSAVHGIVALGLDEKVQAIALPDLREQVAIIVTAIGHGLTRT